MKREIKFRFTDDMGDIYGPVLLPELIERVAYCAKHPSAVFLEAKNNDYLQLNEFMSQLRTGELAIEQTTGLRDNLGVEIFENDTVIVFNSAERKVAWAKDSGGFGLFEKHKSGFSFVPIERFIGKGMEVIKGGER